jgi:succinate-semialdehyde dehydrogenase/glutarate-semialdehyde dehydrogenase
VLAVMPWNFPFWQVIRFAAPALMAGNVGLLKHASNVPQCALALEQLFLDAGFPAGAFQALLVGPSEVPGLIADERVAAVTLTGSEGAGRKGRKSRGVTSRRRCSSSAAATRSSYAERRHPAGGAVAVEARVINNGQSCIAAKRFLAHEAVYEQFAQAMVAGLKALVVGDSADEATQLGPLATEQGRASLMAQVDRSVAAGAKLLCGGKAIERPGWFYEATALAEIPAEAPAAREELFGPVALLHRVRDLDHAIAAANDSPFGLGSSVWTNDAHERERFVREIEAGMTFVNGMVVSDPRRPFGGVKHSGYGRESARRHPRVHERQDDRRLKSAGAARRLRRTAPCPRTSNVSSARGRAPSRPSALRRSRSGRSTCPTARATRRRACAAR